ncbi:MAG: hypothetical protein RL213_1165 [Bacteroidota bacterium]|jgi:uncharacterized membrane protein YjgN (DUF898 family)
MNKKIVFKGEFVEYFLMALGLCVLTLLTLGIALPYLIYWSNRYFFTKLEIDGKKVVFTGGFWEYFISSLGLLVLSVITFGLAIPYWIYWSFKYFFTRLEVQEYH